MTVLAEQIEPVAPLKSRPFVWWMGFSGDMDFDEAERRFTKRHGRKPRLLVRDAIVKAGPIGEEG